MLHIKTSPCFTSKHPHVLYQNIPMFYTKTSPCFYIDLVWLLHVVYILKKQVAEFD